MIKCDIHNPTQAPRVVHGGEDGKTEIRIAPGETKSGVLLPEHVAATLRDRANAPGAKPDLQVSEGEQVGQTFKFPDAKEAENPIDAIADRVVARIRGEFVGSDAAKPSPSDDDGSSRQRNPQAPRRT